MGTCWIICVSVTGRRWMLWCCSTWQLRSPQPWSTWRRKTSFTGRKGSEHPESQAQNTLWFIFLPSRSPQHWLWCPIFNTRVHCVLIQYINLSIGWSSHCFSLSFSLTFEVDAGERRITAFLFWARALNVNASRSNRLLMDQINYYSSLILTAINCCSWCCWMHASAHSKATLLVPSHPVFLFLSLFLPSSVGIVSHYCPDRTFTLISSHNSLGDFDL